MNLECSCDVHCFVFVQITGDVMKSVAPDISALFHIQIVSTCTLIVCCGLIHHRGSGMKEQALTSKQGSDLEMITCLRPEFMCEKSQFSCI